LVDTVSNFTQGETMKHKAKHYETCPLSETNPGQPLLDEMQALRDRLATLEQLVADANSGHCMMCGWPLAKNADEDCIAGNCSYRPSPECQDYQRVKARRKALASVPRI
jgi:hypothetical protein